MRNFKLLALASIVAAGMSIPAGAADVGGSCCADLEERVAELEVTAARKGNRKVSVEVYGQVSKAILAVKADDETRSEVIDNHVSGTRFGFMGTAKISPTWKAGYHIEIGINDQPVVPLIDDQLLVRHSYWWIEGPVGKVSMGLTSMAVDGISSISLANTNVSARMLSAQPLSNAFLLGIDLPFNDLRRNVVRFDTPTVGGFQGSASWASGDTPFGFSVSDGQAWDVALRYAGEFSGFRFAAGVGLSQQDNNIGLTPLILAGRERVLSGSASLMHVKSGLFVNVAAGEVTAEQILGTDFRAGHVQAGWQLNVTGFGATTVYGEYMKVEIKGADVEPVVMGFGVVQAIDAAAMDLYVAFRRYDLDLGGSEIDTLMVGARVRF